MPQRERPRLPVRSRTAQAGVDRQRQLVRARLGAAVRGVKKAGRPIGRQSATMSKSLLAALLFFACLFHSRAARSESDTNNVYLFSTFREGAQDGLRFAFSHDG